MHRTQDAQALLSPEERSGSTYYQYDCAGQILSAQQHFTVRQYCDLAGNLMEERDPEIRHNQLMQYRGWHYQYDAFGRMSRRTDEQAQQQEYRYNSDNRMVEVRFADRTYSRWQRVEYDYDLLGRRTGKRLYRWHDEGEAEPAPERLRFIWDGMRLRGEASPGKATEVLYVYNGDSYEPLARVDRFTRQMIEPQDTRPPKTTVYYYHTALNGLPEAMTSESGQLVYEARHILWGQETEAVSAHTVLTVGQNLRFAGQYFDAETGLHYNTFRFYAPECGRFTQPDPIGLAGGLNLYQYAPNPIKWIDPLGLDYTTWQIHSPGYGDVVQKGLHFYAPGGVELSVRPDNKGGIIFKNAIPNEAGTPKVTKAIALAKEHFEKDVRFRNDILNKANEAVQSVLDHAKRETGSLRDLANGRSREFRDIARNVERHNTRGGCV